MVMNKHGYSGFTKLLLLLLGRILCFHLCCLGELYSFQQLDLFLPVLS